MRMNPHRAGVLDLTRALVQARVRWKHPLYLVHALTARCNAKCGFCAWNYYEQDTDLNLEEVKKLYSDARAAGFLALSIWGGEPLIYRHCGEVFRHANALGFHTNLVTNGALLERRLDDVLPNIDRISISVDFASSRHDEMRGIPGLYQRILSAVHEIRRRDAKKKIVFVCTLQKGNTDRESVRELAEVMKSLGVLGVFNAMRIEAAVDDSTGIDLEQYNPSQQELAGAFGQLRELKERGYPILNSFTHLDKLRQGPPEYRCHWPKFMLPVEANGDVVDCMHWGTRPIGNVRETEFRELLESPRLRALAGATGESCHRCVSLHRVEISEIWSGNMEPVRSWVGGMASERAPLQGRLSPEAIRSSLARRLPVIGARR